MREVYACEDCGVEAERNVEVCSACGGPVERVPADLVAMFDMLHDLLLATATGRIPASTKTPGGPDE